MSNEESTKFIDTLNRQTLYPTVRVRAKKTGGSGTILYSKPCDKVKDEYETYILTNHHVIEDLITVMKEWNPLLKKDVKVEKRGTAQVEIFKYKHFSRVVGAVSLEADLVAYNRDEDLALLKLRDIEQAKFVAELFPQNEEKTLRLYEDIYACGASMGHPPIATKGHLMFMDDEIENKQYYMSSAPIIYGNSGGGAYIERGGKLLLLGVPARITTLGWGFSAIEHMGFFIPVGRIYKFFDNQIFQFIYDPKHTSSGDEAARKKKAEAERKRLEAIVGDGEEEDDE